jgi:hypothetical protein
MFPDSQILIARGLVAIWAVGLAWPSAALAQKPAPIVPQRPATAAVQLTPALKSFADECELLRRGTILRLEDSLRGLKSGHVKTLDNAGTIRQTETDLEALRSRSRMVVPMLRFPTRLGEIGRLPGGGAYVEQVIGPKEALVRCSFRVNVVVTRNQQAVGEVVRQRPLYKMREEPTAEWGESNEVALTGTFQVVGTERYQTDDGHWAAVQVLKPFDMRQIEDYLKRQATN